MKVTPQRIDDDPQPRKFLKFSSSDYKPLNITFDFSNIEDPYSRREQRYLNESVFPAVKRYFEAALKVLPRRSKILVKPNDCGDVAKIPQYASKTGFDSDLVIFVKFAGPGSFIAQSASCLLDGTTGRPVVGVLAFKEGRLALEMGKNMGSEVDIATTIHEIIHILGFSDALFPHYINPETLEPLTGHVIDKTVNGVQIKVLNVAPLTQRVRKYFNCRTAEGAYLENQGGSGSVGSHFERRIFGNEIMTASAILDMRVSEFSLALLEGTGWYKVNYDLADKMTWGKNKGCDFLNKKCINKKSLEANFPEFCSPLTANGVSWTGRAYGYCGTSNTSYTDSNLISEFDYWKNQTVVDDEYSDNCPTIIPDRQHDCEDPENEKYSYNLRGYEFHGPGSRAFMGSLAVDWEWYKHEGYCFKSECVVKSNGNYELKVKIGDGNVTCSAAGTIKASDFDFENYLLGALECPDPKEFCEKILEERYCKRGCFMNGVCSENQCQCKDGWTSDACNLKKETSNSSRCVEDNMRTTAYGDDCICSARNLTCSCALGTGNSYDCYRLEREKEDREREERIKEYEKNRHSDNEAIVRAILIVVGVLVVVLVIFLIKKRKASKELSKALISDQSFEQTGAAL